MYSFSEGDNLLHLELLIFFIYFFFLKFTGSLACDYCHFPNRLRENSVKYYFFLQSPIK